MYRNTPFPLTFGTGVLLSIRIGRSNFTNGIQRGRKLDEDFRTDICQMSLNVMYVSKLGHTKKMSHGKKNVTR